MDLTVLPQDVKNVVEFKQQLMLNIKNEEVEINQNGISEAEFVVLNDQKYKYLVRLEKSLSPQPRLSRARSPDIHYRLDVQLQ